MQFVLYPLFVTKTIMFLEIYLYMYTVGREGQTCDPKVKLKSINDHYRVSCKMLEDYIAMYKGKGMSVVRKNVITVVLSVICPYFFKVLCSLEKTDAGERRAREQYELMKSGAPDLLVEMRKKYIQRNGFKYHYFRVWEDTGKYMSNFPYCMINMLNGVRKLIKGE